MQYEYEFDFVYKEIYIFNWNWGDWKRQCKKETEQTRIKILEQNFGMVCMMVLHVPTKNKVVFYKQTNIIPCGNGNGNIGLQWPMK